MRAAPRWIGVDFGTTNSAVAAIGVGGVPRLATFADGAERTSTFRSLLYVDPEAPGANGLPPRISAGPAAIREYLATGQRGRSGLAHYDSRTGLQWDWDGSPVVHALVCTLGRDAARRLDDKLLYDACAARVRVATRVRGWSKRGRCP